MDEENSRGLALSINRRIDSLESSLRDMRADFKESLKEHSENNSSKIEELSKRLVTLEHTVNNVRINQEGSKVYQSQVKWVVGVVLAIILTITITAFSDLFHVNISDQLPHDSTSATNPIDLVKKR